MKTSYQILWIDDEPESVIQDREDASEFLEDYGIRADITFIKAAEDGSVRDQIQHALNNPELDVLLVDYHMEGMNGAELVHLIRETDHIYLPVVFYSSAQMEEVLNAVRDNKLDGVYIASRTLLIEKFKSVVKSLLRKEHTTKRTRGLLMEGVSEIDARFKEIFDQAWGKLTPDQQIELLNYLRGILATRKDGAENRLANLPNDLGLFEKHISEQFLSPAYDTAVRWRLIGKMLNWLDHNTEDRGVLKDFFDRPAQEGIALNRVRNEYAHKTRAQLTIEHSEEKCVALRRELRRQQANVDGIVGKLA